MMLKKAFFLLMTIAILCSFNFFDSPLNGVWDTAKVIEKGEDTAVYEKGNYHLKNDTCFETQTYCMQPSKLLNKTVKYHYIISNDTLKLLSTLPNGNRIEDHWVRVR